MAAKTFKDMRRTGEVQRFDAMKVKLDDIHFEPDFNVRERDDRLKEHIEAIKQFVLDGGVLPPLEVRPREEGGVWVVDGHCRTEGYKLARAEGAPIEWVEVRPFKGNDIDRMTRIATSQEGLKLAPLEMAKLYKRMRGFGLEMAEIAKRVHKTPQHVGQVLTLADADHDVQQAVVKGEVKASTAIKMVKKHGSKAGAQIAEGVQRAKASGRKFTAANAFRSVKLNEKEVKALDMFISTNHSAWKKLAEGFMDEDERRHLEARLAS